MTTINTRRLPPELRPRISVRIEDARLGTKLSQEKFAELVGTSRRHIIRLENGEHRPRAAFIARLAEATGKPVSWFTDEAAA